MPAIPPCGASDFCPPLSSSPGLSILQTSWGNVSHRGVFADKCGIPRGARFGPFQGKLVNTSEIKTYDDNTLMWEVNICFIVAFKCNAKKKKKSKNESSHSGV